MTGLGLSSSTVYRKKHRIYNDERYINVEVRHFCAVAWPYQFGKITKPGTFLATAEAIVGEELAAAVWALSSGDILLAPVDGDIMFKKN